MARAHLVMVSHYNDIYGNLNPHTYSQHLDKPFFQALMQEEEKELVHSRGHSALFCQHKPPYYLDP